MPEINTCSQCGVPLYVTSQHEWLSDGVIQSRSETRHRLVFFESGNLDHLFDGIAEMLGTPIEHIVIDASRRSTRGYMERVMPDDIKAMIRSGDIDLNLVFDSTFLIWRAMGYGRLTLDCVRYERDEGDFITVLAERPYSVPLSVGNFAGSIEALTGLEPGIEYEETTPGVYRITIVEAENPSELRERLRWRGYDLEYKRGDIEFERCPGCAAPLALGDFHWDQANGSIRNTVTGRRMVITGPSMIDPIFEELEAELGETIPSVMVEAQRRFVRPAFFFIQMALRGLGNIRELRIGRHGVSLRMENAALPLLSVGSTQGLFEKVFDKSSIVEWEIFADGDLEVEVRAR